MVDKRDQTFAPLPARAIADERLSGLDLKTLAAIAAHDRFGTNGVGCTAGYGRLAQLTGAHQKSVPRTVDRLQRFGYVIVEPMGRSRRIRVVYNATDAMIWNQKTMPKGNGTVTNQARWKGNDAVPIGNGVVTVLWGNR